VSVSGRFQSAIVSPRAANHEARVRPPSRHTRKPARPKIRTLTPGTCACNNWSLYVGRGKTIMFRRTIAIGALGLALSAAMTGPAASLTEQERREIQDTITNAIERLRVDQQNQINLLDARIRAIEPTRNNHTNITTPSPRRIIHIHRHYYQYWCPPPWWGPW